MKVLVTGATGKVGSALITELCARGAAVRALVRKPEAAAQLPAGVEAAIGDLLDPGSVQKALEGTDKLYLLNAVTAEELTQGLIAYDLAKRLKLRHVVYHSVFQADRFRDVPHFAAKVAIEDALRQFDLPYTIVRPSYFFQNDASFKGLLMEGGVYPMPLGTAGVSAVDVRDIAEAAAIALTAEGHEGKTYNLVGPELLSGPKAASVWSEALGRPVRYAGHDMDRYEAQMRQSLPAWAAFDLRMMFQSYLERGFVAGEGDVAAVTALLGHAPRRYEDFAWQTVRDWQRD